MQLLNAVMATRMLTELVGPSNGDEIPFGSFSWFAYAGISCFLVIFAGIMSGLTLGLMSLGLVDLEILQRSGTSTEKKQAGSYFLN
jgi:metal transporter CNNM